MEAGIRSRVQFRLTITNLDQSDRLMAPVI